MYVQVVLVLDSRKENSQKYYDAFSPEPSLYPVITNTPEDACEKVKKLEPELIIIYDNIKEDIADLTKNIRQLTQSSRPIIIVLSKSNDINDKLYAIKAGVDDFLTEPINIEELSLRVFAHLRRHVEEFSNPLTKLPESNIAYKILRRTIKRNHPWALLYIDIDNFSDYEEIYGLLAAENLLKSYAAILRSSIDKNDFLGHIQRDSFIIITAPEKADKIAAYLNYAFDSISYKFYNEDDAKRGYLILSGDEKAGHRISLVSTSIGIISNQHRSFHNYQEAVNSVINIHKLAKLQPGSSWVSDRPKITSEYCALNPDDCKKKILIVESDAAMAYLLTTTLEMQGYKTNATSNIKETLLSLDKYKPDLIVLDVGSKDPELGLTICTKIKSTPGYSKTKVILSTIIHDKEKALDAGADLYLPKPYDLLTLYAWISKFFDTDLF